MPDEAERSSSSAHVDSTRPATNASFAEQGKIHPWAESHCWLSTEANSLVAFPCQEIGPGSSFTQINEWYEHGPDCFVSL